MLSTVVLCVLALATQSTISLPLSSIKSLGGRAPQGGAGGAVGSGDKTGPANDGVNPNPNAKFAPFVSRGFTDLEPDQYACFDDYCLTSGTYDILPVIFDVDFAATKTLRAPSRASVDFFVGDTLVAHFQGSEPEDKDEELRKAIEATTTAPPGTATMKIDLPTAPSCVCLHFGINLRGGTKCFGTGEDNFYGPLRDSIKSISFHGTKLYVYAFFDAVPGQDYTKSVPDGKWLNLDTDTPDLGELSGKMAGLKIQERPILSSRPSLSLDF
ncbi:MAG: hypothetical protein M1833_001154 [Piccolia ochrophora]|nr:MAG: hypothetical protein M1833_001154 [Piccolia ochrophora]